MIQWVFMAFTSQRKTAGTSPALYGRPFFPYTARAMADELLQRFTKSYAPGAVIFREGEEGEEMYIIQKGKVRVSKSFAGKPHVLSILDKGEFFGEMAIVNRIRRTATVTAIDAVELLAFDREGLLNMITKNARIGLSIIDRLCRRLQNAHLKIQHLVKRDQAGLIALHLLNLFQELTAGEKAMPFGRALDDVSLSLELPREEVELFLSRLHEEGVLRRSGESLELLDPARLAAMNG
jgi:CRP/FNR family transcriptional regulator, cyclic AMP receptor protein